MPSASRVVVTLQTAQVLAPSLSRHSLARLLWLSPTTLTSVHRDDDLAARLARADVADRLHSLAERIGPIDGGPELALLEELLEDDEVGESRLRDEEDDPLLQDPRAHEGGTDAGEDGHPSALVRSDEQEDPVRHEDASHVGDRAVPGDVEDRVVAPAALREVLFRVVDDLIGAERADQLEVPRACDRRHVRSERLRDLHRERSDTPAGAVHEDPLSRLHLRVIAKTLECGASRDADRGRLLERRVARLWCETLLARERVLGERRGCVAEDLVARGEARHAHADRLDDPGEVHTADRLGLLAHQGRRHAYHDPAMQ